VTIGDWLLSRAERGNEATTLDDGAAKADQAWSEGNLVRPLVHGGPYFAELAKVLEGTRAGDTVMFVDWRGDPDELLTEGPRRTVAQVLSGAAARGVNVHGLVWRSHLDQFQFSEQENRHLDEEINAAGGCCLLDMRVRTGGSHHQKFVVVRHAGRPELDVAFLGGIDLCHSRRDDGEHNGDPQRQPMAAVYSSRPPWHDVQLMIRGPAVADVETVFRERWDDPQPLTRNPMHRVADRARGDNVRRRLPDPMPAPQPVGPHAVQLLRTYPRRMGGYPFAPHGERSIARGYLKALTQARELIYVEDQYLWSRAVAGRIAVALANNPNLRLVAVLPLHPDQDGRVAMPPNLVGRAAAMRSILSAAPDRVGLYGIENSHGVPIYVHAKVCVIDDIWATTGSDNFNRRSWTHDSELTAAVWDHTPADATGTSPRDETRDSPRAYARQLRVTLSREHLGAGDRDTPDLADPRTAFDVFAAGAARLEGWYAGGRQGPRPPGRLRPIAPVNQSLLTRLWATPMYRVMYDPDGRRLRDRLRDRF
jgi:phosphatidylserine/phosphatidylglycerophosphate/cardiolipin synthase-like enzyme